MDFFARVDRMSELLLTHGRLTRRGLSREFGISEEEVSELAEELVVRGRAVWQDHVLVATAEMPSVNPSDADASPSANESGEIRHLTVMFCDLVGSTELSGELSPEAWTRTVRAFHEMARGSIEAWDGHVGNYMGDGLVAYFGYPVAQEDAGERAVRAGLAIVGGLAALNAELEDLAAPLHARVGLHSGPVVVDEFGGVVQAMGETANIAARVEGAAPADGVAMSAATRRLVSGVFVTQELGRHDLKGVAEPIEITRVLRVGGVAPRLGPGRSGQTPLVGRALELGLLQDRWEQVKEGWGQVVLITGEAGIGKSRLVDTFREALVDEPHSWLDASCSPYAQSATLYPMAELHRRALNFSADAAPGDKIRALRSALGGVGIEAERGVSLLAELHGLPITDPTIGTMSAEHRRVEVFELLIDWLLRLARLQPTVFFLDDIHWSDPSTLEVFHRLADEIATEKLMLVTASRPDRSPEVSPRSNVTPIQLSRMTREQTKKVALGASGTAFDDELLGSIVQRSDGVPLFAEELALAFSHAGDGGHSVPATLNDLLMARLEQLGPIREIAQSASVIGREFRFDEITLLSAVDDEELWRLLDLAVGEELLYRSGTSLDATYVFKHALMRDAVYASMLGSTRERRHRQFAVALVERRPARAADRPDLIAEHLTAGNDPERASTWWERAGDAAEERAAVSEAEQFYQQALATADDSDSSRLASLGLRYAGALNATRGFGHADLAPVWQGLLDLPASNSLRLPKALAQVGQALRHVIGARFGDAQDHIDEADRMASAFDFTEVRAGVAILQTLMHTMRGHPVLAIEQPFPVRTEDRQTCRALNAAVGVEAEPLDAIYRGYSAFLLGRFAESREQFDRAGAWIADSVNPTTRANFLALSASMWAFRGEPQREADVGAEAEEVAKRYGLGFFAALGGLHRSCGLANTAPNPYETLEALRLLGELASSGALIGAPLQILEIARAQALAGLAADARDTADYALAIAEETDQHLVTPQLEALKLRAQADLGELADHWRAALAAPRALAIERHLAPGRLALALVAADLSFGTDEHAADLEELATAIDAIPEPDDAPVVLHAVDRLASLRTARPRS